MRAFLATVLSVIAVGVLLIAYGLFNPRVATAGASQLQMARPMFASERVALVDEGGCAVAAVCDVSGLSGVRARLRHRPPGDGVSGERRAPGANGV